MPIIPKDLVDLAYEMLQSANSEVRYRTIINRAYYGAFLAAREKSNNNNNTSAKVHNEVGMYFKERNRYVYNALADLFEARKKADYRPNENTTIQQARDSCTKAKKILDNL